MQNKFWNIEGKNAFSSISKEKLISNCHLFFHVHYWIENEKNITFASHCAFALLTIPWTTCPLLRAGSELGILLYYLIKNGQTQIGGNSCSQVWAKYIKTWVVPGLLKLLWMVYSEGKLKSCLKLRNFQTPFNTYVSRSIRHTLDKKVSVSVYLL